MIANNSLAVSFVHKFSFFIAYPRTIVTVAVVNLPTTATSIDQLLLFLAWREYVHTIIFSALKELIMQLYSISICICAILFLLGASEYIHTINFSALKASLSLSLERRSL